jgi:hypothetical protein
MRKFIRARSKFFDGIIDWPDGILLLRPYAYAEAFGFESSRVKRMCREGELPHLFDGETYLIVIDTRKFGEGGKFAVSFSPDRPPTFPLWKGQWVEH